MDHYVSLPDPISRHSCTEPAPATAERMLDILLATMGRVRSYTIYDFSKQPANGWFAAKTEDLKYSEGA
jgi:hypothetical protein